MQSHARACDGPGRRTKNAKDPALYPSHTPFNTINRHCQKRKSMTGHCRQATCSRHWPGNQVVDGATGRNKLKTGTDVLEVVAPDWTLTTWSVFLSKQSMIPFQTRHRIQKRYINGLQTEVTLSIWLSIGTWRVQLKTRLHIP